MAQPHKGDRRLVQTRLPESVYAEVRRRAEAAGTSTSQYISDLMAIHAGMPAEVRDLGRAGEELSLAI